MWRRRHEAKQRRREVLMLNRDRLGEDFIVALLNGGYGILHSYQLEPLIDDKNLLLSLNCHVSDIDELVDEADKTIYTARVWCR